MRTARKGLPDAVNAFAQEDSKTYSLEVASQTITAMSASAKSFLDASALRLPSSPASSMPAVSISTHAPRSGNSIAFRTGSVVVPGTSDTMDTAWPAIAFTSDDFPAFLLPKNAMRSLSDDDVGIFVQNLKSLSPPRMRRRYSFALSLTGPGNLTISASTISCPSLRVASPA